MIKVRELITVYIQCVKLFFFQSSILIQWIKTASHFTYKGHPKKSEKSSLRKQVIVGSHEDND